MSTIDIVRVINAEDEKVATAVGAVADTIASAIDVIVGKLSAGGRLIYVGAGTSGRLGVLDASECPPTFNVDSGMVVGLIAGGPHALTRAVEGAEDSPELATRDLDAIDLNGDDVLVGIAASGGTPYVLAALDMATSRGAATIAVTCNRDAPIAARAEITIAVVVGAEILAGSTRLKAGTATKLVLNTLTTGSMVRLGKTYGNLMVDVQASNAKLMRRSVGLVQKLTGLDSDRALGLLERCDGDLKTAVVCQRLGIDVTQARNRLVKADGRLRKALEDIG